jgi:hypothetical protein
VKTELDVVKDLSTRLGSAGIAYMLSGSMAMNYYAVPRMTRDVDVVVALSGTQVDAFVRLFQGDYYISAEDARDAVTREGMFNLIHNESLIKVDCIVRKSTEYRRLEFERRRKITIQNFDTFIVSKEDLVLSKLQWARESRSEMQLKDIRNLLDTGYDEHYLRQWAAALDLTGALEEALHG